MSSSGSHRHQGQGRSSQQLSRQSVRPGRRRRAGYGGSVSAGPLPTSLIVLRGNPGRASGGPPGGYGFAALVPELVRNKWADDSSIIGPSHRLGHTMVRHFASATGQPVSTYLGAGGIQPRNDLAGLNLSLVPKVFIEPVRRDGAAARSPWRLTSAVPAASAPGCLPAS